MLPVTPNCSGNQKYVRLAAIPKCQLGCRAITVHRLTWAARPKHGSHRSVRRSPYHLSTDSTSRFGNSNLASGAPRGAHAFPADLTGLSASL